VRLLTERALGLLLLYPSADLRAALPEIGSCLRAEKALPSPIKKALADLIEWLESADLLDLQEHYTCLFDRGPSFSLHLFEHVYGEGRDRGRAMAELIELYRREGLALAPGELPDYLPVMCEYLSITRAEAAAELVVAIAPAVELLRRRLQERGSPYAAVMASLGALAEVPAQEPEAPATREREDNEQAELTALDRTWEDKPVSFGADSPFQVDVNLKGGPRCTRR
jgi:nitrate reductase delta subunit